jgi:rRNA-processing protein EBP2
LYWYGGFRHTNFSFAHADLPGKSKKRLVRDAKYGFGGRKKLLKQNTAESSADMNALSRDSQRFVGGKFSGGRGGRGAGNKHGSRHSTGVKNAGVNKRSGKNAGAKKRPGKNARQAGRGKGR